MNSEKYISINQLCTHYQIESSFLLQLNEMKLIEIKTIKKEYFIPQDTLIDVEKMLRMHHQLGINIEGIDAIFNLLHKINALHEELNSYKNRFSRYEN